MSDPLSRPRRLALQAIVFALALTMLNAASFSQEIVDSWRYTLRLPSAGWQNVTFDATDWTEGQGGFGTSDTPGSRIGTTWSTNNIWLRKSFELEAIPENPALWMHHDEDAEVFITGQPVAKVNGFTSKYEMLPLPLEKRSTLKLGRNVLAVHCRQTTGGQFIDVHLVNGGSEPTLPIPARSTRPFQSELVSVCPEIALLEDFTQSDAIRQSRRVAFASHSLPLGEVKSSRFDRLCAAGADR